MKNNRFFLDKLFKWILTIPFIIFLIIFSVSNKQSLEISLWPIPWSIEIPVYFFSLGILLSGFVFGYIIGWGRAVLKYYKKTKKVSGSTY
ncbi:MAG: hypothetical protein CMM17_09025 [Rhodospirillaceae bacterium]|nr:hypothetical protein [Rhodospirillaceae bacterium]|tara:strand:- start:962 stop:1231 length:270 start_codon:yes stop_codon:yes gene_type:complete